MGQVNQIETLLGKKRAKKVVQNLVEASQCNICHEVLNVPMMIACGHNYCYLCLKNWFMTNETKAMGCPDCRTSVSQVPSLNLFVDHQIKFIFELISSSEGGSDSKLEQIIKERDQDESQYKEDLKKENIFDNIFKNSTLAVADMDDDGIPRCGNCHWELDPDDMEDDDNVCPHCHFRIRNSVATNVDVSARTDTTSRVAINSRGMRYNADEYSDNEFEEIVDEIQKYSESDIESDDMEEDQGRNSYISRSTSLHDVEAEDEDEVEEDDEEENEDEHDSEMDSFIEDDEKIEEDDGSDSLDEEQDDWANEKKRKYVVLDDEEEEEDCEEEDVDDGQGQKGITHQRSSDLDSDYYEHNDAEGFVSGDSLDDGENSDKESVNPRTKRQRRTQVVLSDDE